MRAVAATGGLSVGRRAHVSPAGPGEPLVWLICPAAAARLAGSTSGSAPLFRAATDGAAGFVLPPANREEN